MSERIAIHPGRAVAAYWLVGLAPFAGSGALLAAVEAGSGRDLPVLAGLSALVGLRFAHGFLVTALYHRGASHGAVRFHPAFDLVFRVWGWLATGLSVGTWAAVHRWHHATGEEGPFSPSKPGESVWSTPRQTIRAHWDAVQEPSLVARFRAGLPDDRLERFLQGEERRFFGVFGLRMPIVLGALSLAWAPWAGPFAPLCALASLPGLLGSVLSASILVVNGVGHAWGERTHPTRDTSTNVVRRDWLLLGEALHHNHHARPGAGCFAFAEGEVDPGWWALVALRRMGAVTALRP